MTVSDLEIESKRVVICNETIAILTLINFTFRKLKKILYLEFIGKNRIV